MKSKIISSEEKIRDSRKNSYEAKDHSTNTHPRSIIKKKINKKLKAPKKRVKIKYQRKSCLLHPSPQYQIPPRSIRETIPCGAKNHGINIHPRLLSSILKQKKRRQKPRYQKTSPIYSKNIITIKDQ